MKWALSLVGMILVVVLGWLPFQGTDIASLEPAEILYVYINKEEVGLETEGGWLGKGTTVADAVRDLQATTPGQVFLQTVDFLLVEENAQEILPQLYPFLRSGCGICIVEEKPDLKTIDSYLRAHRPHYTLQDHRAGNTGIPKLIIKEDRVYLDA